MSTRVSFLELKRPGNETYSQSKAEVMNEWSRTSVFPYAIMTCGWTLNNRLGFPHSPSGRFGVQKNLLRLAVRCPARSPVTIPTELYAIPATVWSNVDVKIVSQCYWSLSIV